MSADPKKRLHVLIVENNLVDSKMLRGMLEKSVYGSFDTEVCDSLENAFRLLSQNNFDVVLLDLNLQDSTGLDTLRKMNHHFPDLPIVVNTGAYQDDLGLKAVRCGAQDYLIKGKYLPYGLAKALYYAIERKKAEKELQATYTSLRETQAQLIQVEKFNVVGGLASGVAHEVKNPLATILYGIEYLDTKLEVKDDKIRLTLDSIKEAAKKANNIIKDLLDFASLSVVEKRSQDLNQVIDQSLNLILHQCDKCAITIVRQFQPDLPQIKIDKNRVEQVILDLLINAINAMEKDGQLIIKTYARPCVTEDISWGSSQQGHMKEGDLVLIADIEDSGPGIRDEDLPKVFDPFFTTRRAAGGIGLGLAIARTIMSNHNGIIKVANRPEGGARARLIFCTN